MLPNSVPVPAVKYDHGLLDLNLSVNDYRMLPNSVPVPAVKYDHGLLDLNLSV